MSRKTIEVDVIKDWVNTRLQIPSSTHKLDGESLTPEQAFRLGVSSLMEQILHATGNYKGFNYQASEFVPAEEMTDLLLTDSPRAACNRFGCGPFLHVPAGQRIHLSAYDSLIPRGNRFGSTADRLERPGNGFG
jgi:hypothetical protein